MDALLKTIRFPVTTGVYYKKSLKDKFLAEPDGIPSFIVGNCA